MQPDANTLGLWVMCAAVILNLIVSWRKASGQSEAREISPQPLRVREDLDPAEREHNHPELITASQCRAEHEKDRSALSDAVSGIRDIFAQHNKDAEARASHLHDRIDPIAKEVATVSGRLNDHLEDHRAKRI
jgi:hypothetical protein